MPRFTRPFKIAFPVVRLPVNRGAKPALIVFSFQKPDEPNVCFSTCIDIDGGVHQEVPFVLSEIMNASKTPMNFMEVDELHAPTGNLILPPRS